MSDQLKELLDKAETLLEQFAQQLPKPPPATDQAGHTQLGD
jgi:hypothetical protein